MVSQSQELKTFRAYSAEVAYADKETGKLGPFDVKPVNILVTMQGYTINVYAKSHLRLSIAKINEPELDDIGSYLLMKCVDHNGKVAIVYLYTTKELKYFMRNGRNNRSKYTHHIYNSIRIYVLFNR